MKFSEVVTQTLTWLQREGRVSYRALKLEFELNDDVLDALKEEIIEVKRVASDENGKVLVWVGKGINGEKEKDVGPRMPDPGRSAGERRQLTVMFCDLVGSTALSTQLDPEDYRLIVQQYQQTCTEVIQQHEGYLAQYLGDGLLVYFGYPTAHEDDARRAVRAGLGIIAAIQEKVPFPLVGEHVLRASEGGQGKGAKEKTLQVRIGIHTGLVVVGEIGSSEKRELLALGETPNIAARIQGLAEPNTVLISTATQRLIEGQFESQPFGSHLVKGIDTPVAVYHVQSERQNTSFLAGRTSLTPLVGREQEVGLLVDRWEQVKEGRGQIVLLSGEPGIGKSRLAYTLREHVTSEGSLLFEARCSPYHQHSALYPLIDVLQRTLLFTRQDTDDEKVVKLERALALYDMQESLLLFTALLSLPTPPQHPPLTLTPQKQKERTLQALVQLLVAQAERQATVSVWEDLHWSDPSSLEFLSLLIEQTPTTKLLLLLTFRPEFAPPWKPRSHITQITLNRLGKKQVEAMIEGVGAGQKLAAEVVEQIRAKTDGVPLFVEELTKNVIESVASIESIGSPHHTPRPLAIPATLQEALLARLDRLSTARQVAQLGATLGREFSYDLLQVVTPLSETDLQAALAKLVEAEILYQRGVGEQARYFFKHALIQDTAYQSLLKSTRQQYHQQIARVLEERFPDTNQNQPELLAHHYTEAGLIEQAIPYWQQAGARATRRSANEEAITYFTKGIELLKALPDTPERTQQELTLQLALGAPLIVTKSWAAPEVGAVYTRTQELCRQIGETPLLFQALEGLWLFHFNRGEFQSARGLAEQLLDLAQRQHDPAFLMGAHSALGTTLFRLGELVPAQEHLEKSIALADPQTFNPYASSFAYDPRIASLSYTVWNLWMLGYMDRALKRGYETLTLAQELSHPFRLAFALVYIVRVHQLRREVQATQEQAEALIRLGTEQGFAVSTVGHIWKGWALVEQGQEEGIGQMQQSIAAFRTTGTLTLSSFLGLLAESCGKGERAEEGLAAVAEALALLDKTGERFWEAELYRLKGELTLQQFKVQGSTFKVEESLESGVRSPESEAEECFQKAIGIACKQQAKSLELRAVMSLVRLRQHQTAQSELRITDYALRTRLTEAHTMLSEVYNWFTEGFDTKDLQEAKGLIEELQKDLPS